MSQQLQITGGAKVRSLEGVITGSTGVLGSLPINGANGIPQLDSNGKILVSQLPNSVMEYLGTWNVTTNTPYLVNGTGNAGDVYLVEGAATGGTSHDFGAGAITFYNGDQVIYSGSIWQRGAGSSGTVTSIAITESGDALTITGSPITNSGTINIGFAGTSAQYVAGNGTLVTFPTITTEAQRLITEVYNETGATLTKGTVVYINGGHGNLPTIAKALATGDATSAQTYGVIQSDIGNNNNGYVVVIGSLSDLDTQAYSNGTQLYLSSTTAGAWTSTKQYAPAHLVYVGIVTRSHPTQGVVEIKIQNGYELDELHNVSAQTPSNNDGLFYNSSNSLWENKSIATALGYTPLSGSGTTNYVPKFTGLTALGNSLIYDNGTNVGIGTASPTSKLSVAGTTAISGQLTLGDTITNGTYTYTLPSATGTLALTSDIPSVTNFVTLNTLQTIIGTKIYTSLQYYNNGVYLQEGTSGSSTGYTSLAGNTNGIKINLGTGTSNNNLNFASTTTGNTYTFPNATGTIALTTDLSSYVPTSRTLTINGTTYDLSADRSWTVSGSQWTTSGSDIYYNTGNVSIGSSTPSFAAGTGLYVYSATRSNLTLTDGTNVFNVFQDTTSAYHDLRTAGSIIWRTTTGNTERMRITSTGNVGINCTPNSQLEVFGTSGNQLTDGIRVSRNTLQTSQYGVINYALGILNITGVNTSDQGEIRLNTSNGTSVNERLRVTSAGNVGIGTSSPSYTLDVTGTGRFTGTLTADGVSIGASDVRSTSGILTLGGTSEAVRIVSNGNVGIGTTSPSDRLNVKVTSNGNNARFDGPTSGFIIQTNSSTVDLISYGGTTPAYRQMNFSVSANTAMSIKSANNGTIIFGTSEAAANSINFYSNYSNSQPGYIIYNNSGQYILEFNGNTKALYLGNLGTGTLYSNSGIISNSSPSDERLKNNIETLTYGLKDILKLRPVSYTWKNDKANQGTQFGFIAQEVQNIIPEAVKEFGDDIKYLGLEKDAIYAALINAIKELNEKIEKLQNN